MKTDISGKWYGKYRYDATVYLPLPPGSVSFELELNRGWFGRFKGLCRDDEKTSSFPRPGVVKGTFRRGHIFFVKYMPDSFVWIEGKSMTARDAEKERTGKDPGHDPPHPPLYYDGSYDDEEEMFRGCVEDNPTSSR